MQNKHLYKSGHFYFGKSGHFYKVFTESVFGFTLSYCIFGVDWNLVVNLF